MDSSELMLHLRAYLFDKLGVPPAHMSYDYDMAEMKIKMSDWRPLPQLSVVGGGGAAVQLEGVTGHVKPDGYMYLCACDVEELGIGI